jgi:hypothetical protein
MAFVDWVEGSAVDCNLCHIKVVKFQLPGVFNRYLGGVQDREILRRE